MDHSGARVPPPHGEMNVEEDALLLTPAQTQLGLSQLGLTETTVQVTLAQQHQNLAQSHQSTIQSVAQSHRSSLSSHQGEAQVQSSSSLGFTSSLESTPGMQSSSEAMPVQHSIIPQDRSSLDADIVQTTSQQPSIENFQQQQRTITQNLVYQPRDPQAPLPPTNPPKTTSPKSSKTQQTTLRINNPPESDDPEKISPTEMERRRVLLRQQHKDEQQQNVQTTNNSSGNSNSSGSSRSYRTNSNTTVPVTTSLLSISTTTSVPVVATSSSVVQTHPSRALQLPQAHNYEELDVIGNGAYGTVYRGRCVSDRGRGRFVALKKIKITLTEDGVPVSAVREISLLKQLETFKHPNVVRLLDICHGRIERENRLNLVLVFEYVEMDLDTYLKKVPSPGLEPHTIRNLMHQILSGVDFLHCNRIIHRDLKPQNILVDRYDRVKIADFGLARIYDYNMKLTTMVVTLWYRAPEILLSNSYATPVDIWSCACIFAELFRKRPLFDGQNEGDQLQRIFDVIGTPSERDWPSDVPLCISGFRSNRPKPLPDVVPEITNDAADLMQRMLAFVPGTRASAQQSLCHQYFDGFETLELVDSGSSNSTSSSSVVSTSSYASVASDSQQRQGGANPTSNTAGTSEISAMICDDEDDGGHRRSSHQVISSNESRQQQSHHLSLNQDISRGGLSTSSSSAAASSLSDKSDHDHSNDENNPNSSNISSNSSSSSMNKVGGGGGGGGGNQLSNTTTTTPVAALFATPAPASSSSTGNNNSGSSGARN
uniref:cyclin-dependent kinase n=1 Tax=Hirondellea gigas TaxID=1518452 RepID=A0A2P2I113_9CRUS